MKPIEEFLGTKKHVWHVSRLVESFLHDSICRVFGISLTGLESSLLIPQKLELYLSTWTLAQACESDKCVSMSPWDGLGESRLQKGEALTVCFCFGLGLLWAREVWKRFSRSNFVCQSFTRYVPSSPVCFFLLLCRFVSLLVFPLGLVFAFNLLVNDRRRCRQTVCQAKLTMLGTTYWGGAPAFSYVLRTKKGSLLCHIVLLQFS